MNSRKPFIVAEISANHLGSLERALQIIDAAKAAGADAVKFQTYTVKSLVSDPDRVIPSGPWAGRSAGDLYSQAQTPRGWHETLFAYARSLEIEPFSTPFSPDDVDFLEELRCPRYKIASFEIVDHELIGHAAKTGKPLIMSTGMAEGSEINDAVEVASAAGCTDITLLKCTSGYPAPVSEANLASIQALSWVAGMTRVKVGLSDHSCCGIVPISAAALGADVIEAHLTLRRSDGGPDAAFSYQPDEFHLWAECARIAAQARGQVHFGPTESETPQLPFRGRTVRARNSG